MVRGEYVFCKRCYKKDGRTDMWIWSGKLKKNPDEPCAGCGTPFRTMDGAARCLRAGDDGGGKQHNSRAAKGSSRSGGASRGRSATRSRFQGWRNDWDHQKNKPKRAASRSRESSKGRGRSESRESKGSPKGRPAAKQAAAPAQLQTIGSIMDKLLTDTPTLSYAAAMAQAEVLLVDKQKELDAATTKGPILTDKEQHQLLGRKQNLVRLTEQKALKLARARRTVDRLLLEFEDLAGQVADIELQLEMHQQAAVAKPAGEAAPVFSPPRRPDFANMFSDEQLASLPQEQQDRARSALASLKTKEDAYLQKVADIERERQQHEGELDTERLWIQQAVSAAAKATADKEQQQKAEDEAAKQAEQERKERDDQEKSADEAAAAAKLAAAAAAQPTVEDGHVGGPASGSGGVVGTMADSAKRPLLVEKPPATKRGRQGGGFHSCTDGGGTETEGNELDGDAGVTVADRRRQAAVAAVAAEVARQKTAARKKK